MKVETLYVRDQALFYFSLGLYTLSVLVMSQRGLSSTSDGAPAARTIYLSLQHRLLHQNGTQMI